jgi:thiamine biosynthesis lipoprotein
VSYILSFIILCHFTFIPDKKQDEPIVIEGHTMGTTYRIIYFDELRQRNFKFSVDSLLALVNKSINTYDSTSEISRFNRSSTGITFQLPYFYPALKKAKEIYKASKGAFDPTVMPLVNAWGFGPQKSLPPSVGKIDSLKALVGFDKIQLREKGITKSDPRVQLDMGGIGQGYGADIIFGFLKSKKIKNMLVELGGEGVSLGKNLKKNKPWRIGILDPDSAPDHQFFKAYVTLQDKAFTTSGNYFNYRIINGRKFGHTIDPVTGYPVQHEILSASVFANDGTTADGWATAFMVMGLEKAIAQLKCLPNVDALFIYSTEQGDVETYITRGMKKFIIPEQ